MVDTSQREKNCPASIFEGFRRKEAMQTYEGIAMQFTESKGYLTIQATEEGYSFIFYDSDLHEIQSGDYDNPDASIQEVAYETLKSERMDDLECVKVDYKEFEEMTIQHSKDLLQEGELRATSEIGRNELALNSLSRAEAEDVVQETLIRVWNKRDEWSLFGSIEAYCLTVARNLAIDRSERKDSRTVELLPEMEQVSDASSPYEKLVNKERMALIHRLMSKLPEKQRLIMQLRDVEGKSYKEIAAVLNLTEEQVKVNLFRARQKVKQTFIDIEGYGL